MLNNYFQNVIFSNIERLMFKSVNSFIFSLIERLNEDKSVKKKVQT